MSGSEITVGGAEGHHAAAVRRIRPSERVTLLNGVGGVFEGPVLSVDRAGIVVRIDTVSEVSPGSPVITVVQALPKGDRGGLAVELMTEVGVDVVVPWQAHRCVQQWRGERIEKHLSRWRATADAAAKQSRRPWWPRVADLANTEAVLALVTGADVAVLLDAAAPAPLPTLRMPQQGNVVVIVGPEGGLTSDEVDALTAAGAKPLTLGPTVVRTSTAGVVAAAVILAGGRRWSTPER